ncbi:MAG: hypothetical protein ACJATF_001506, partial [Flavobacteriales bacterium]
RVRRSSQANSDPAILGGLFLSGCGGGHFSMAGYNLL